MTDLRKAAQEAAKILANALSIDFNDKRDWYSYKHDVEYATNLLRQALAQPEQPMSPEHLPRYVATNGVKPMEGGGGGGSQPEQSKYSDIVSDGGLDPRNKFDAQQAPVAFRSSNGIIEPVNGVIIPIGSPLYTAPPSKQWVGLTDEERRHFNNRLSGSGVAEDIEAKLKEKNA